jgi:hypothetical protein
MYRNNSMTSNQSFSAWNDQRQKKESGTDDTSGSSSWFLFSTMQDSFVNQMQDLYGILPDAGPLSAEFRGRLMNAVYLLIGAIIFALLAVFIGIPTLLLRPSKFVFCLTLATLLAASSVIVLQKPSIFISNLWAGGITQAVPVLLLFTSVLFTFYVTVFYHRYSLTLFAGVVQVVCLVIYLASFIPGGTTGLNLVWRMLYTIVMTSINPCIYMTKQTLLTLYRSVFS